jgi:hypothetical protein
MHSEWRTRSAPPAQPGGRLRVRPTLRRPTTDWAVTGRPAQPRARRLTARSAPLHPRGVGRWVAASGGPSISVYRAMSAVRRFSGRLRGQRGKKDRGRRFLRGECSTLVDVTGPRNMKLGDDDGCGHKEGFRLAGGSSPAHYGC